MPLLSLVSPGLSSPILYSKDLILWNSVYLTHSISSLTSPTTWPYTQYPTIQSMEELKEGCVRQAKPRNTCVPHISASCHFSHFQPKLCEMIRKCSQHCFVLWLVAVRKFSQFAFRISEDFHLSFIHYFHFIWIYSFFLIFFL